MNCPRHFAGLLVLGLGACTALPLDVKPDGTAMVLKAYRQALHAAPESRAAALQSARTNLAAAPTLAHRLQVALLLTLPDSDAPQWSQAQELLRPCDVTPADDALASVCELTAELLRNALATQQKVVALEEGAKEAERHAQDLQRELAALYAQSTAKLEADAHKRITGLEHQLSEQRTRLDAMRQQLQELKAIERSIDTRREVGPDSARAP